jgi:hypothetical protein
MISPVVGAEAPVYLICLHKFAGVDATKANFCASTLSSQSEESSFKTTADQVCRQSAFDWLGLGDCECALVESDLHFVCSVALLMPQLLASKLT